MSSPDGTPIVIDDASIEEIAAADETQNHIVHILKVIFIIGKIGIVIVMMAIAIWMYMAKYRRCTMIPVMLFFFIFIVSFQIGFFLLT